MTIKGKLILHCIAIPLVMGGVLTGGYFLFKCPPPPPGNDIGSGDPVPAGPTTWTKKACPDCGDKIQIQSGMLDGNVLGILVFDECKSNPYKIPLTFTPPVRRHALSLGYALMYDIDSRMFRHNLDGMYHWQFKPIRKLQVSIGLGPVVQFADSRVYQVGARVEGRAQW
jgi:hypothetical protein